MAHSSFTPCEQPTILRLLLPSSLDHLALIRIAGRVFVHALPGGAELFPRVELALVESVTNAICHGNREDPAVSVEVIFEWRPPNLEVRVSDCGPFFEPQAIPHEDVPPVRSTRGRGLFLMRSMSDDLRVERHDGGNLVTLVWHTHSDGQGDADL